MSVVQQRVVSLLPENTHSPRTERSTSSNLSITKQNCRQLLLRSMPPKFNFRKEPKSTRVQDNRVFPVFSPSSPRSDIRTPVSKKQGRNHRVVDDEDDVDDDHDEDNNESNDEISNEL
jgi:hypothetical protein